MNAVSYIRVSSTKQLDGDGPERQRAGVNAFPGFHIDREFIDDISGTKLDRPAFEEMLDYCQQHSINTILIDKTDRFTRDLYIGLQLIGRCAALNLNVIDCTTGKSITKPENATDQFLVKQLMLVAELNKNLLVETMAAARKRIRLSGRKCEGQKAYRDLPQFNHIVQRIDQLYAQNRTSREIAHTLNSEGLTTKYGKPWSHSGVCKIIRQQRNGHPRAI